MIAKLIVWGNTREEALQRLQRALTHYYIGGVKTNIPFLQAICQHPKFVQAQLSTDFLSNEHIALTTPNPQLALLMAVSFDFITTTKQITDPLLLDTFSWQMHQKGHWVWRYQSGDELTDIEVTPLSTNQFRARLAEKDYLITASFTDNLLQLAFDDQNHKALVDFRNPQLTIYTEQGQITLERFTWAQLNVEASPHKGQLTAPMPATVVAVLKNIGDAVKAGERLIILEAMKMEHTIHAPADGILKDIFYTVGSQVNEGAELLSLSEMDA